jgi:hypothetical protein
MSSPLVIPYSLTHRYRLFTHFPLAIPTLPLRYWTIPISDSFTLTHRLHIH